MQKNPFVDRKYVIWAIFVSIGLIFIIRLFYIQVVDDSYKTSAANNSRREITIYPARGLIYDRDGELLVYNEATYDLMVTPNQIKKNDSNITELCEIIGIGIDEYNERLKKAKKYSGRKPSIFEKQLSKVTAGYLQEKLYKFSGFYLQPRTLRNYPNPIAAHILGFIGEVNQTIIDNNNYYKSGDYIGVSGLEKSYEEALRGIKGKKIILVDNYNREKGSFQKGQYDVPAEAGKDLVSSISVALQQYGEKLMQNKKGSIVAIEPSTGEILAFISAPSYDPNLLVGRIRSENYVRLLKDPLKPLFDRALMAQYPPGSIFKIVQALIGMEMKVINPNTGFVCNKSLVGCHNHPNASNVAQAIQYSCNPYFYQVYRKIIQQGKVKNNFKDSRLGLAEWHKQAVSFGLGQRLGIDLPSCRPGVIPDVTFYDKWYGKNRWAFSTIYSNSIGQGEVEVVPLQMANLASIFANRGFYYVPHLIKAVGNSKKIDEKFTTKNYTTVSSNYFEIVAEAMSAVVNQEGGTARRARINGIEVCGKTGTAQNLGEDHSVFIAFAPKENPKIAIAVYVENSGFGGTWAAPIASLMIEKYINDSIQNPLKEQTILEADFIHKK
ncbi:MAG: penicillin-binding protein 2 [Saprospiraceae bacterium]|nr:penicillin-binding protein 2 [Saprospiraceae bacterium]